MWVNVKVDKKEEKRSNNTLQTLEATQTFDDNQTLSMSWINIIKTNINKNTLKLQKIINALWIRKKVMKLKRPFLCEIVSGKKQKRVYIFPWIAFFFYNWIQNN